MLKIMQMNQTINKNIIKLLMQKAHLLKLSQKQFMKIPLFRSVKQINGERIFKKLYEHCSITQYHERITDKQQAIRHNFTYVIEGEVFVYKVKQISSQKSLIKSYRAEQYYGFQDYPLFWGEQLEVQVSANTKLVSVPLAYFYRFFRRVIPMTYLQSKAEYLKKLALFKGIQLQKIFKLACISQKYKVPKESILTKEGQSIQNIFLICSGKLELVSSLIKEPIYCKQNQDFLAKQVRENIPICYFTSRCVLEADILILPKGEFKKVIDIKLKLQQTLMREEQLKQQTMSVDGNDKSLQTYAYCTPQIKYSQPSLSHTNYAKSRTEQTPTRKRQIKSAYKPRQTLNTFQSFGCENSNSRLSKNQQQNISLGEIQLLKFIRRKQKVQTKNFFKYIQSRAPEIIINPSKQFALFKPIYKSSSQYVRNMKRKIKQSTLMNYKGPQPIYINPFQL